MHEDWAQARSCRLDLTGLISIVDTTADLWYYNSVEGGTEDILNRKG